MIMLMPMVMQTLKGYSSPYCKLGRLVKNGTYTKIVRGMYETDPNTPGHYLAQAIRNPSYLSFEWALSHYGLIPEAVRTYTCATYLTHRSKRYSNHFGNYSYNDTAPKAFPYCTRMVLENGYSWWIAEPEKAICDQLYRKPPVYSMRDLEDMLFEDMRIDEDELLKMSPQIINELSKLYGCTNVKLFSRVMQNICPLGNDSRGLLPLRNYLFL